MSSHDREPISELSTEELESNHGARLPDKHAMSVVPLIDTGSLLDGGPLLNVNLDLNLDLAAPIDAAIAANANVGAPIDAAVSANILSGGAQAIATAPQDSVIVQELDGVAVANASQ